MKKSLWAGIVLVAVLCMNTQIASAKRGLAIINTGEDVTHLSDIKDDVRAEVEADTAPGVKIGMIYSRVGLFWMDIWRWDKRHVLYDDNDAVWEVPEEALKEIAAGSMSPPFTMTIPPGLIVLIVLGLAFGALMFFGKDEEDEEMADGYPQQPPGPAGTGQQPGPGHDPNQGGGGQQ